MIRIEDKNGENIEVLNLAEEIHKKRQAYWQDLYEKLVAISNLDVDVDVDVEQTKQ